MQFLRKNLSPLLCFSFPIRMLSFCNGIDTNNAISIAFKKSYVLALIIAIQSPYLLSFFFVQSYLINNCGNNIAFNHNSRVDVYIVYKILITLFLLLHFGQATEDGNGAITPPINDMRNFLSINILRI